MTLDDLTKTSGEWLRGTGPESDIVMCSRIRLARNLADFPFSNRASRGEKSEIETHFNSALAHAKLELSYIDVNGLSNLDRQFLVERQIISRELATSDGPRGVALSSLENIAIMVNEEDHLRVQFMFSGFRLPDVWDSVNQLDDQLEEQMAFAFSPQLGYLTACPTNVGTGIRVGVMLHLPGLVQTKQIDKVFRALQKINLAVRGLYGEGSQASGDFYQISNQQTLGKSEPELIKILTDVVPPGSSIRALGPAGALDRTAAAPPRPGEPRLRRTQDRPDDLQRGNHALALERAHGNQSRVDRRPVDRHRQRALHPNSAGVPAETAGVGAGSRRAECRPSVVSEE
jgi:protein arginine kinase